jgi:AcrR family transcriptional regulator
MSPGRASPLRQQIVTASVELTTSSGWSSVTMAHLAELVGVSRQTVYNEIGSKPALAEAVVLDELGRFLSVVERAFDRYPGDLLESIHVAVGGVLELAQDSALLRAVVSATHGADTELLPPLTTQSRSLLAAAKAVMSDRLASFDVPLQPHQLANAIDAIVRVVLSHIMAPSESHAGAAEDITWLASRLLAAEAPVVSDAVLPVEPSEETSPRPNRLADSRLDGRSQGSVVVGE